MKKEQRTSSFLVRMTRKEKESLERQAKKAELSMSEYVRRNIACPPRVTREDYNNLKMNLLYEIRKIGVNINQIAKKYNEYRLMESSRDLIDRMDELRELTKQFITVMRKNE